MQKTALKCVPKSTEDICSEYVVNDQKKNANNVRRLNNISIDQFFTTIPNEQNILTILDSNTAKYSALEWSKIITKTLLG